MDFSLFFLLFLKFPPFVFSFFLKRAVSANVGDVLPCQVPEQEGVHGAEEQLTPFRFLERELWICQVRLALREEPGQLGRGEVGRDLPSTHRDALFALWTVQKTRTVRGFFEKSPNA